MAKYNDLTVGQSEACINRMGGWDNFLRFIGGEGKIIFETLLAFVRTVKISAQPAMTTSYEYFEEAGVVWMGDIFRIQFLDIKVVASNPSKLKVEKLTKSSLDAPILAELGENADMGLSQFRAFLAENRESSERFVFYICGDSGDLLAVRASWCTDNGGWRVEADTVENPYGWDEGSQIVSHN